ncbi:hypothetical protein [Microbacterium sp. P05]|uniref:hypothetical protein n=1 Tax=Microbacterium sp. P05 TaxID=3366948 RepID=UPI003744B50C
MWDTFWPDVLVAVIGALVTVLLGFLTYLGRVRLNEKRSLRSLVESVHRNRAFAGEGVDMSGAGDLDDYRSAVASVAALREDILLAREHSRQLPKIEQPLSEMTRACDRFLENSETSPDDYAVDLESLEEELSLQLLKIERAVRGVKAKEPGGGAS